MARLNATLVKLGKVTPANIVIIHRNDTQLATYMSDDQEEINEGFINEVQVECSPPSEGVGTYDSFGDIVYEDTTGIPDVEDTESIESKNETILDDVKKTMKGNVRKQRKCLRVFQVISPKKQDQLQDLLETKSSVSHHSTLYKCDNCFKAFLTDESFRNHINKHNCDKKFTKKYLVDFHNQRPGLQKNRQKANNVCETCGYSCGSITALEKHQRIHTGEKPFQCPECPKRFRVAENLQLHLRTHTGERPFKCLKCPKAFANRGGLDRHDRVHTGVKPYSCSYCDKTFTQSNGVKLHVRTVHLKMPAPYLSKKRKNDNVTRNDCNILE